MTMKRRWRYAWPLILLGLSQSEAGGRTLRLDMPAPTLGQEKRAVRVYLPPSYDAAPANAERRYPVVYLLHGFPGRSGDWFGRGHAAESAETLIAEGKIPELIVVCPDGNRGFFSRTMYANAYDGSYNTEDFMTHDLIAWADSSFRTIPDASHRGIIGLSDGGTAAVNLVMRHPTIFGAAGSHSGEFRLQHGFDMRGIVGPAKQAAPFLAALSALDYLRDSTFVVPHPTLYFDCGTGDESYPQNVELHELLDSLGVAHTFRSFPGTHTWSYWREHFPEALEAVARGM